MSDAWHPFPRCRSQHNEETVANEMQQHRILTSQKSPSEKLAVVASPNVVLGTEPAIPRTDHKFLTWRPFYLNTPVLLAFVFCFCFLIVGVEALHRISLQHNGLASSLPSLHYLWTYGPAAVFIVIGVFWARLEYQIKELAPWRNMSGKETKATKSILLDYISPFQPVTIYLALLNGHLTVAAVATCTLLFKGLVVFSAALMVLSPTRITVPAVPITLTSTFSGGPANLSRASDLPFDMLDGILEMGLPYPMGLTDILAYQTFNSSPTLAGNSPVLEASVDALMGQLDCQKAEMIVHSWYIDNNDARQVAQVRIDFVGGGYTVPDVNFIDLAGTPNSSFVLYQPGHFYPSASEDNRCIVVVAATPVPSSINTNGNTSYTNFTVATSDQYICWPSLVFTTANVAVNQSEATSTKVTTSSDPRQLSPALAGLSAWDFVEAQLDNIYYYDATQSLTSSHPGLSDVTLNGEIRLGLMQAKLQSITFPGLLQNNTLAVIASKYFQAATALYAHVLLKSPASMQSAGSAQVIEDRLQIRNLSVRAIESGLALVLLFTLTLMFYPKSVCPLPRSPSTLLGLATLVRYSHGYIELLKGTGATSFQDLKQSLADREVTSGVVGLGAAAKFVVHVDRQSDDDRNRLPLKPSPGRQDWQPFVVSKLGLGLACSALVAVIVISELLLASSQRHQGLSDVSSGGWAHYSWAYVPATVMTLTGMWYAAIDFNIRCMAPYLGLKNGSPASQTISLCCVDEVSGITLLGSFKRRQWTVFATTLATVVASTLTIAVSGVYSAVDVPLSHAIQLQPLSSFATSVDQYYQNPLNDAPTFRGGSDVAGLLVHANMSYPAWTYNELAFPQLAAIISDDSIADSFHRSEGDTIETRLLATRASYTCKLYNINEMDFRIDWDNDCAVDGNLQVNVTSELRSASDLSRWGMGHFCVDPDDYFGASFDVFPDNFYSDDLYIWGHMIERVVASLTAMTCNETFYDVETDATFVGSQMAISNEKPPVEDESTLQPSKVYYDSTAYQSQMFLPAVSAPNSSNLDKFFLALVYGKDGISLDDLGDFRSAPAVMSASNHLNSLIRAQFLNQYTRVPVNTSTRPDPIGGTLIQQGHLRITQNPLASRILEGLLGLMLLCTIVAITLTDTQGVMPKNPCSIAARTSLVADSSLVTSKLLPDHADAMSDEELNSTVQRYRFRMGWFADEDVGGNKVYKVDIVPPEDEAS